MLRSMFLGRLEWQGRSRPENERENKESDLDRKGERERGQNRESGCYGDREGKGLVKGEAARRDEERRLQREVRKRVTRETGKTITLLSDGLSLPLSFLSLFCEFSLVSSFVSHRAEGLKPE